MNKLVKTVSKADLIPEFLNALNEVLSLTKRELDTLIEIIKVYYETPKPVENVVNHDIRKIIKQRTGITFDNLARYIARFKRSGILVKGKSDGEIQLNKAIIPEIIGDRVQITLVLRVEDNDN